jgi:transcription factor TFIIIB component B''
MMVRGQKKVNIDIEEYKASQRQWQPKDTILEEHAKLAEEHERDVARLREERRAAGLIDDDPTGSPKANATSGGQENEEVEVIEEDADALGQGGESMDVDMVAQPEDIEA